MLPLGAPLIILRHMPVPLSDSYSMVFHEAADAVKFCLQVSIFGYTVLYGIMRKWVRICYDLPGMSYYK